MKQNKQSWNRIKSNNITIIQLETFGFFFPPYLTFLVQYTPELLGTFHFSLWCSPERILYNIDNAYYNSLETILQEKHFDIKVNQMCKRCLMYLMFQLFLGAKEDALLYVESI